MLPAHTQIATQSGGQIISTGVISMSIRANTIKKHNLITHQVNQRIFNAILVNGSATGDVMFYGKGAGKLPTASAVVADVIDIVRHDGRGAPYWEDGGVLTDVNPDDIKLYVRVLGDDVKSSVADIFGEVQVLKDCCGEYAFISAPAKECELNKKAEELKNKLGADAVCNTIQVMF